MTTHCRAYVLPQCIAPIFHRSESWKSSRPRALSFNVIQKAFCWHASCSGLDPLNVLKLYTPRIQGAVPYPTSFRLLATPVGHGKKYVRDECMHTSIHRSIHDSNKPCKRLWMACDVLHIRNVDARRVRYAYTFWLGNIG